jgi:hypothetical protein
MARQRRAATRFRFCPRMKLTNDDIVAISAFIASLEP